MPRKQAYCARGAGHGWSCTTPEAMERQRQRRAQHERVTDAVVRRRWNDAYRFSRYGLTRERFDRLLEIQDYACAMCRVPFGDGAQICIDHDHDCCEAERSSCGACIRGLLCLRCNVALGYIERMSMLARAYLASPPGPG